MSDDIRRRLKAMSDEGLLDMIDKNPGDYSAEELRAAQEEAERRGGTEKLYEMLESRLELISEDAVAEVSEPETISPAVRDDLEHALLPHGLFSDTRTLKDETLSEVQFLLIPDAADYADRLIEDIQKNLEAAEMPLDCHWGVVEVKTKGWISRVRRDFLIVELDQFPDYHTYISARSFGTYLDCMRALTVEPGFVKKFLSRKLTGDEEALSAPKNILKHQDLSSWNEVVKDCMKRSIDELLVRLGQQPDRVQIGEKKFLDIW